MNTVQNKSSMVDRGLRGYNKLPRDIKSSRSINVIDCTL